MEISLYLKLYVVSGGANNFKLGIKQLYQNKLKSQIYITLKKST